LALARDAQTGLREIADPRDVGDARRRPRRQLLVTRRWSPAKAAPFQSRRVISAAQADAPLERQIADAIRDRRLRADPGLRCGVSAGAAEIRRNAGISWVNASTTPASRSAAVRRARTPPVQDRAIAPAPRGQRKVVAGDLDPPRPSLTIEGVRTWVDFAAWLGCRGYEPDIGPDAAGNVRASRAAVDQRRGRAGRTEPGGVTGCGTSRRPRRWRLTPSPKSSRRPFPALLDLAQWGVSDPGSSRF